MARRAAVTDPLPAPVPLAPRRRSRRAVVASAKRFDVASVADAKGIAKLAQEWQALAWTYHDLVGELKFGARWMGNSCSRLQLGIGIQVHPGDAPLSLAEYRELIKNQGELDEEDRLDPATIVPDSYIQAAEAAMRRLESGVGVESLQFSMGYCLFIAGEAYLAGLPADPVAGTPERWEIISDGELVEIKDAAPGQPAFGRKASPDGQPDPLPEGTFLLRVWRPHERWHQLADSNVRACLNEAAELVIHGKALRAIGLSRVAAGVWAMDNGLGMGKALPDQAESGDDGDDRDDPFAADLLEAWSTPIQQEGTASATVPIVLRGDFSEKAPSDLMHYFDLGRKVDPELPARCDYLIARIAHTVDLPTEILTGVADANHWSAWQITDEAYQAHVEPTALIYARAWTQGYVVPSLQAMGLDDPVMLRQLTIRVDPSRLISRPNRAQNAEKGHAALVISDATYREALGFDESDAPTDTEIERRIAVEQTRLGPELVVEILNRVLDIPPLPIPETDPLVAPKAAVSPTAPPMPGQGPPPASAPPAASPPPARAAARIADLYADAVARRLRPVLAAGTALPSARRNPGARLADIDRGLRARLLSTVDAGVARALERAGARMRTIVAAAGTRRREPGLCRTVSLSIADVPNGDVWRAVPAGTFATLGIDAADALSGTIEQVCAQVDTMIAAAQARARAITVAQCDLDDHDEEELAAAQDDNRRAAIIWLAGALSALVSARLSGLPDEHPALAGAPAAHPVGTPPPPAGAAVAGLGESPVSVTVPPSLIREAMAIAGGETPSRAPTVHGAVAPVGSGRTGMLVGTDGEPVGGVATGDLITSTWAAAGRVTEGWRWVYGDPSSRHLPFAGHEDLDGVEFASWDDDVLAVQSGDEWVTGIIDGFYAPGDHDYCQCDYEPIFADAEGEPAS